MNDTWLCYLAHSYDFEVDWFCCKSLRNLYLIYTCKICRVAASVEWRQKCFMDDAVVM